MYPLFMVFVLERLVVSCFRERTPLVALFKMVLGFCLDAQDEPGRKEQSGGRERVAAAIYDRLAAAIWKP